MEAKFYLNPIYSVLKIFFEMSPSYVLLTQSIFWINWKWVAILRQILTNKV